VKIFWASLLTVMGICYAGTGIRYAWHTPPVGSLWLSVLCLFVATIMFFDAYLKWREVLNRASKN
jgi:phosphatidylserine synthase